jgi:hypothetical protein
MFGLTFKGVDKDELNENCDSFVNLFSPKQIGSIKIQKALETKLKNKR